jgi:DNA (cytosine-5)-methyltransferase 1
MELLEKEVNPKYYLSHKERQYMDRETADGRNHWDFQHYHDTNLMYSHCVVANTYKGVPYNVLADRRNCKYGFYDCDFIDQDDNFCGSCTNGDCFQGNNNVTSGERKLTPLECFRLMGFDDKDYYILKQNKISDTQLYKMAGNSIVVQVLEEVFKNLFINK